jgi:Cys-tRNA(Pro)/Cys-tRNA(Cys) deacylase
MSRTTRATQALQQAGIAFTLHPYDYDAGADSIGLAAAQALCIAPRQMLKTLMAEADGKPVCVVLPADREVSMKKLAALFSAKSAQMMKPAAAERLTGFHVGGISPFGQKRAVPTAIEQAAMDEPLVYINAGQRGLLLSLPPERARDVLHARCGPVVA